MENIKYFTHKDTHAVICPFCLKGHRMDTPGINVFDTSIAPGNEYTLKCPECGKVFHLACQVEYLTYQVVGLEGESDG
jgi:uncharacterized Zn-finger protein